MKVNPGEKTYEPAMQVIFSGCLVLYPLKSRHISKRVNPNSWQWTKDRKTDRTEPQNNRSLLLPTLSHLQKVYLLLPIASASLVMGDKKLQVKLIILTNPASNFCANEARHVHRMTECQSEFCILKVSILHTCNWV